MKKYFKKLMFGIGFSGILTAQVQAADNFCTPFYEYAEELERFAHLAAQSGVATRDMVEEYLEIAKPITDCKLYRSAIRTPEEAQKDLTETRLWYQSGLTSELEVKGAEYRLSRSEFCKESSEFLLYLVRQYELREQAGFDSTTGTIGFLRKAAELVPVCTK